MRDECRCGRVGRRRGSVTVEWVLLFTLLLIGSLAGLTALYNGILRQHDAIGTSVEGMNFRQKPRHRRWSQVRHRPRCRRRLSIRHTPCAVRGGTRSVPDTLSPVQTE